MCSSDLPSQDMTYVNDGCGELALREQIIAGETESRAEGLIRIGRKDMSSKGLRVGAYG